MIKAADDHEVIWLEPGQGAPDTGRLWCTDDVWSADPAYRNGGAPTKYVRADLVRRVMRRRRAASGFGRNDGEPRTMSRYADAAHRIQTAIAALSGADPDYQATQPKHMRTGLDLSKSDMAGLVRLLIAKGVLTEVEYIEAITSAAEEEAADYERQVQAVFGHRGIRTV